MGSPSATAARRRPAGRAAPRRRRTQVRRRRRTLVTLTTLALVGLLVIFGMPLARKAVNDLGLPLDYAGIIRQQAAQKHLDAALIAAVIYAETKFDPRPSSAGAEGPMQILPQTALYLAHRSGATTFHVGDLNTPAVNIAYGSYYLRYLLDEYHDRLVPALAAYNGGEANVNRWLAQDHARGRPLSPRDIPFPETQAYVEKVLTARRAYRHTYARQLGYS